MNAFAGFIGWLVIWAALAVAVAIPLGKLINRRRRYTLELAPDDRDLSTRPPFGGYTDPDTLHEPSRYVPPQFRQFDDDALSDTTPHDPAP